MTAGGAPRRTRLLLIGTLWAMLPAGLTAQRGPTSWVLEGHRGSFCVRYLVDPALTKDLVPDGATLVPASHVADLDPGLAVIVRDEPRFGDWIPGVICLGMYDRLMVDGRQAAAAKDEKPLVVAISSLAATGAAGVAGTTDYLIDLLTDSKAVQKAAGRAGINSDDIRVLARGRDEADPTMSITIGSDVIFWAGHPVADSSVGTTRKMSFGYAGNHHTGIAIAFADAPGVTRAMVGALSISGRSPLAKALKASPIRAVGPAEFGGSVTLQFQSATTP